jgi:heme/copper-type cytochrome/quinol oxidase subunit 3
VFFLTTGFHGLHVTGGLVAFLFLLGQDVRGQALHA